MLRTPSSLLLALLVAAPLSGCRFGYQLLDFGLAPSPDSGSGTDSSFDSGTLVDAAIDAAAVDAASDAGLDAAADAGADGALDASADTGVDAGTDAGIVGPPTFSDVCALPEIVVITVGDSNDDDTGALLASFAKATCGAGASVQTLSENTPGLLDPDTRGPLLGPSVLGVVGGAEFNQDVMGYLIPTYTPVVWSFPGSNVVLSERSSGSVIVDVPVASLDDTHDYAIVQVTHDPVSDSVILSGYGVFANGTLASGYWFANVLGVDFIDSTNTWYVVEWTDAGSNGPSADDTFTLLASG